MLLSKLNGVNFFTGVVNETPEPVFMLIASIALIILCIVTFDKMGINDIKKGAVTGIWFGALIFTFFGFQFMGVANIVSIEFVLTDIFISSVVRCFTRCSYWMVFGEILDYFLTLPSEGFFLSLLFIILEI